MNQDEPRSIPQATSMPSFAPLYSAGTERVEVRWLGMTYPTDPAILESLLPAPLTRGKVPEVGVWVAEFIGAEFITPDGTVERRPAYMQGGVSVRCDYHGADSAYAVITFVEGLNHGVLGREQFGLPKKQAREVRLQEVESGLDVSFVTARGIPLLSAAVDLDRRDEDERPAPEWFDRHLTHKLIPSAEGTGFDISRLVEIPWAFSDFENIRHGEARVTWAEDRTDPLHLLAPAGAVRAHYGKSVLSISYGTYREHVTEFTSFGSPSW